MHKRKLVQYLGKYIRNLKSDQISSRLLDGEFELRDVELEVAPINELLVGVLPYTLELHAGVVDHVHVWLPWNALRTKPVRIRVGSCRVTAEVHQRDDSDLVQRAARRQCDLLAERAAAQAKDGNAQPTSKLSDMKVVVTDNLEVSVASVELLLVSSILPAPAATPALPRPMAGPAPLLEVVVRGISLGPSADGRGSARLRGAGFTTFRRRIAVESFEVRARHEAAAAAEQEATAGGAAPGKPTMVAVECVGVDLVEWRDLGRAGGAGSWRMCNFPRELRADVQVPHVEVRCHPRDLGALATVARDAAAPPLVPIEALPVQAQYLHWSHPAAAAVAEAVRTRIAASRLKAASKPAKAQRSTWAKRPAPDVVSRRSTRSIRSEDSLSTEYKVSLASVKTGLTSASTMARGGATVAATGALKTAGAAGAMAQRASSGAVAGANLAAAAAKKNATEAASMAQKSATVAAGRAAAGARIAQGTAAAAAQKAVAARQAAADKALGAASMVFGVKGKPKLKDKAQDQLGAEGRPSTGSLAAREEEMMRQAILASLADQPADEEGADAGEELFGEDGIAPDAEASGTLPADDGTEGIACIDEEALVDELGADEATTLGEELQSLAEGSSSDASVDENISFRGIFEEDNMSAAGDVDDGKSLCGDVDTSPPDVHPRQAWGRSGARAGAGAGPPPPLAKRLLVHVAVDTLRAEVRLPAETLLVLEVGVIDLSVEDLRRLAVPEAQCLEKLGLAPPAAVAAAAARRAPSGLEGPAASLGGSHCATVGRARIAVERHGTDGVRPKRPEHSATLFHSEATPGAPWLLTVRGGTSGTSGLRPQLQACVHGARAAAAREALPALKALAEAAAAASRGGAVASKAPAVKMPSATSFPSIHVTVRNTMVDLAPDIPLKPLRALVPAVLLTTTAGGQGSRAPQRLGLPSVPPWHASMPPAGATPPIEPDFTIYSEVCGSECGTSDAPRGFDAAGGFCVAERQWRLASAPQPSGGLAGPQEVLVPAGDFVELSQAKLRAVEHAAERDMLEEVFQAGAPRRIARETARRIPHVRELLDDAAEDGCEGTGPLEAQLAALEAEVVSLEEEREAEAAALRGRERSAAEAVATARLEHLAREAELHRKLDEERAISQALAALVEQQAVYLTELRSLELQMSAQVKVA